MCTSRRHVLKQTIGLSCLLFTPTYAFSQDIVPADDDLGCDTLEDFETGVDITLFSPAERQSVLDNKITPYGTFIFSKRWKRSDGLTPNTGKITLGCYFMNGNARQQKSVIKSAQSWISGDLANFIAFDFSVDAGSSQIRINLGGNRNNSYVGRDNLAIPSNRPTMNLANFNRSSTVQHEFGHALGLRHEHRFPGAIKFNEDVVVRDMRRRANWTTATTYRNILTPLSENAKCIGDPSLNEESIMMYTIPKAWTEDGKSYQRAGIITERDRKCMVGVYSA